MITLTLVENGVEIGDFKTAKLPGVNQTILTVGMGAFMLVDVSSPFPPHDKWSRGPQDQSAIARVVRVDTFVMAPRREPVLREPTWGFTRLRNW
jgi:hypothetical protein